MLKKARVAVFVPAYNAARHLAATIERIPREAWDEIVSVWVIDDGSTDETARAARVLGERFEPVRLKRFENNQGYGNVVREGLALCQNDDCDIAVCLHGDGQYPPEEMPRFVQAMRTDGYDILQGSRIAGRNALAGGMPLYKYIAGRVLTGMENRVFGLHMTDYHSGYLFYSRRALAAIPFDRLSRSFDFDLEVIASARARKLRVGELPIPTRYADEVSYLNPVGYGLRVLRVMARYIAGGYRP
ncbi:MAG: glycosyltransferase [Chitinivibrionales bacterium]|nr:glycosyltransferase [Chitinivibrionales bacterium]